MHLRAARLLRVCRHVLIAVVTLWPVAAFADDEAPAVLRASGVRGGVAVHVGCGDGTLTASLGASGPFLVEGLTQDPGTMGKARAHIESKGLSGRVTVRRFDGRRLPYAENLVALVVSEDLGQVTRDEVMRVLRPGGVVCLKSGGAWKTTVKPWPEGMDVWTHFLHSADGNAVSRDRLVGPPRHVQWMDGPLWARHHDTVPSVNSLVSERGRIFYMVDEAPAGIGGEIPDRWFLAARDAFSGVLLWKRPVAHWGWRAWSGMWKGRFNQPNHVAKRLVAVGDRVYVTLGFNAPLSALDAATGETLKTYEGTEFTDEILYHKDLLVLAVNHGPQKAGEVAEAPPIKKSVMVLDPGTGKIHWKTGSYVGTSSKTGSVERVTHLSLAAQGDGVYVADADQIVGIDLKSGKEIWKAPRPESERYTSRYFHLMSDMITMVATDDTVFFAQLEPIQKRIGWGVIKTGLYAFSTKDGSMRWKLVVGNWGHFCVPDVFVIRGQVWVHDYKTVAMIGLDPKTGEEKARVSTEKWFKQGHHHRCYRNKATERFILTGFRGVEYLDIDAETHTPHHWSRGGCRYGILPCNGLYYATPHPCECYIKAKLNGLYALAPRRGGKLQDAHPLLKGPAFGSVEVEKAGAEDWPTYRRDASRGGSTAAKAPEAPKAAWNASLGGRITPPVVANGRLYVSAVDAHTLHALDAKTGKPLWRRVVGGRIDSPPTAHGGLVLFGCADGWVYACRASDGEMAWRLRAAPSERRIVFFNRLESAWPVHGSVLVEQGVAHVSAGRSSYLDDGIRICSMDPMTGKLISSKCIYSPDPETEMQPLQKGSQEIPGVLSDVLVGGGEGVYMRHLRVDGGKDGTPPVMSTGGFLNDDWFNRTGWIRSGIRGQLLVFDAKAVYGIRAFSGKNRSQFFYPGGGYELFSFDPKAKPVVTKGKKKNTKMADRWSVKVPIRVRGMVLAGDRFYIAGPMDEVVEGDPWAAFDGRKGGVLWAVSTADGKKLSECALDSPPVFDGLIAAGGCLYLSTVGGKVVCLK